MAQTPWENDPIVSSPKAAAETRAEAADRRAEEANKRAARAEGRGDQAAAIARAEFIAKYGVPPESMPTHSAVPGDETKTGDEYLATLEPALAAQVKALAEGRRAFPTGAALRAPQMQQLVAAATQYDPALDAANAATRVATRKDFTSGMSARNLTALNTAIGHLHSLKKAAAELNNTSLPPINTAVNAVESGVFADPRVNNFNTIRDAFATELAKVFKGTGAPSLQEITDWQHRADANQSPEQAEGFVKAAADLLDSRINAVGETYKRGMGQSKDPLELLTPHARELYADLNAPSEEKKTIGLFDTLPEGAHVAGEDIKGWRYSPEGESAVRGVLTDPKGTPEAYAAMVADKAVAEGHIPAEQRDDYYKRNLENAKEFFSLPPEERALVGGPDYSAIDKSATENAGFGDAALQTMRNSIESGANLVGGVTAPLTDAAASLFNGERRGIYKAVPDLIGDAVGLTDTGTGKAMLEFLGERYGTTKGLKRGLITDPLGVAGDASLLLTGGGSAAARLPGYLGRAGQLAAETGRAIDPLMMLNNIATKGGPLAAKYASKVPTSIGNTVADAASELVGLPSGVGGGAIREGAKAGRSKGLAGEDTQQSLAFTGSMRRPEEMGDELVNTAREAVGNLRDQASQRYRAAMEEFGQQPVPLDVDSVRMSMSSIRPKNYDAMLDAPHRPSDHLAWQQMNDTVEHYAQQAAADPSLLDPLAVDQFKQDLYSIGSKVGGAYDKDAARIAGTAYGAVKKLLVDHDPIYAKTMKDYEKVAKEAQQLEQGFGLAAARGKSVNVDAANRKLQSIMRNNAQTNYGQRAAMGERLQELDPSGTLMPLLGGQMASSWTPRTLLGRSELGTALAHGIYTGGAAGLAGAAIPAFALTSPRLAGEAAYGAGRAVGAGERLAKKYLPEAQRIYKKNPTAALGLTRTSNYADEEDLRRKRELLARYGIMLPGDE